MKIVFIGGGNMATALIAGLLRNGLDPASIRVVEVDPGRLADLKRQLGVDGSIAPDEALRGAEATVFAVKPQQMREACTQCRPWLTAGFVLTIAAGIRATSVAAWTGQPQVVRAMPNTPALIGAGITGMCAAADLAPSARDLAERIMGAAGEVVWFDDESMLDAVTATIPTGTKMLSQTVPASMGEGRIAAGLAAIQNDFADVAIGSYPKMLDGSFATDIVLRSRDAARLELAVRAVEALIDLVLSAYEYDRTIPLPALLVFGPFMLPEQRAAFASRAAGLPNVRAITFNARLETLIARAAGIVAMGGYNTFCEILSFDKRALIVPRTAPRLEQFIRARAARNVGLIEMLDAERGRDPHAMATALRQLPQQGVPSDVVVPGLLDGLGNVWRLVAKQLAHPQRGPAPLEAIWEGAETASADPAVPPARVRT